MTAFPLFRTAPWLVLVVLLMLPQGASAERSWYHMTTGNGHGFQIFDRKANKITYFLEQPYRYVAPENSQGKAGVGRRDLAHDIYFGLRVGDSGHWLNDQSNIEYEAQTHIIHGNSTFKGVTADTYYFAPFGYEGNGMVMLLKATNTGSSAVDVSIYAKPNMKLGPGRVEPSDDGETIQWLKTADPAYGFETGGGGGHVIYMPLGPVDHASCGSDGDLYNKVLGSGDIGATHQCQGNSRVLVLGHNASIAPGESVYWGQVVLFVNDNPTAPQAADFKDDRSMTDIVTQWSEFRADRSAQQIHEDALDEFETWRKNTAPSELTATEKKLWRQSESVLRMGQIREAIQDNRNNLGMLLAALPIGEWHTGWVRDALYAVAAFAMTGHIEESQLAMDFFLGSDNSRYAAASQLKQPYRISVCRYFGNGVEEADWNSEGPNIETDGWGLVLWGARMHLHYSCDLAWLDSKTRHGDTVFEALHQIAKDIEFHIVGKLPGADASIWEVHWNLRQVFGYTAAAQIRGLLDFADIADAHGRVDIADHFRAIGKAMLETSKLALVYQPLNSFASHMGVAGQNVHVDGSTAEFFSWFLVDPDDPIYLGTMTQYSRLVTGFGGYRRLEPQLSLTGAGSASEYDLSEWILLDLRISDAWRRMGKIDLAETLLHKVTNAAVDNDFLVPELFDPGNGSYTGVVPMVGYGAGAWMMSQLDKYGAAAPRADVGFGHCNAGTTDGSTGDTDGTDDGTVDTGDGTGDTGGDTGTSGDTGGSTVTGSGGTDSATTTGEVLDDAWDDEAAGLCSATRANSANTRPLLLLMVVLLLLMVARPQGEDHV